MVTDDGEAAKKPAREEKIGDLGLLVLQDSVGFSNFSLSNKIPILCAAYFISNGELSRFPQKLSWQDLVSVYFKYFCST